MKYLFKMDSRSLRRHPRVGGDPEKTNNTNGLLQFETAWIPACAGMAGGESEDGEENGMTGKVG